MLSRIQRIFKHRWREPSSTHRVVSPVVLQRLGAKVASSEQFHSGEIRIYVEAGLPLGYLWADASMRHICRQRALAIFSKLRIWDTARNNGVLIYLLLAERAIEVVADRGLSERVDPQTWEVMVSRMRLAFQRGQFEEGLMQALDQVSALLTEHFPLREGEANPNELPDLPLLN